MWHYDRRMERESHQSSYEPQITSESNLTIEHDQGSVTDPAFIRRLRLDLELIGLNGQNLTQGLSREQSSWAFAAALEDSIARTLRDGWIDSPENRRALSIFHALLADYYADPEAAIRAQRLQQTSNDVDNPDPPY
jgi:hypothetical protein